MRLGLLVEPDTEIGALAHHAELAGFEHLWVAEDRPVDAGLVLAAAVLAASSTATVSAAFVDVRARDRVSVAAEAHRLVMDSAARFELGVRPDEKFSRLWAALRPTAALWVRTGPGQMRRDPDRAVARFRDVASDLDAELADDEQAGVDAVILRGPFSGAIRADDLASLVETYSLRRWL